MSRHQRSIHHGYHFRRTMGAAALIDRMISLWAIKLCRFAPGELDPYDPYDPTIRRLPLDAPIPR